MPRGEWMRTGIRTRCEQVSRLDIRELNVNHGWGGIIFYDDAGTQVRYRVDKNRLIIDHAHQVIHIDRTPCNYGGYRSWFLCPRCNKRVAILYEQDKRFRCRQCHVLPYTSQRVSECDRLLLKVRKIRGQLRASRDLSKLLIVKPKGMHWRTFEKLRKKEKIAHHDFIMAMAKKLNICGRYGSGNT